MSDWKSRSAGFSALYLRIDCTCTRMHKEALLKLMSRLVDILDSKDRFVLEGDLGSTLQLFKSIIQDNDWDFRNMGNHKFRATTTIGYPNKYVDVTINEDGSCAWLDSGYTKWTVISAESVNTLLRRKLQDRLR